MKHILLLFVLSFSLFAQTATAPAPSLSETESLKIQLFATRRANLQLLEESLQMQKRDFDEQITKFVAELEAKHEGWTLGANWQLVKKPEPKLEKKPDKPKP